jgi:hypothetical protein
MAETFQKEITFLSREFDEQSGTWEERPVTKIATFKEFSRTDKEQHKLHFRLIAIYNAETTPEDGGQVTMSSDGLYDLVVKAVKTLLVPDENFNLQDKNEFLNDSGALLSFGLWLLGEKITPFFSTLKVN